MDSSPWGHKDLNVTERLRHAREVGGDNRTAGCYRETEEGWEAGEEYDGFYNSFEHFKCALFMGHF